MRQIKRRKRNLLGSVALMALAFAGRLAQADQVAVGFDVTRFWNMGTDQGVYGWQFTANSDIQVVTLGIYDNPGIYGGGFVGDGLVEPHVISIWDLADHSTPLISAGTPVGIAAPLSDGFRYVNVSPIVLHAGHDYVIAASDLAVHGPPGKADVLIYPANFVAKRWERQETQFLEKSYNQIAEQVRAITLSPKF